MGRFTKKAETNSGEAQEVTTVEDTMTDVFDDDFSDEFVEEVAEVPAEVATEEKVEAEPDITEFVALIESSIERDEDDVVSISDESIAKVREAYRNLTRKEKNLAKNHLSTQMEDAIMEHDDVVLAKLYLDLNAKMIENVKAPKKTATPKAPADPYEPFARLIAKLDLARALVQVPGDLDAEVLDEKANELYEAGAADAAKDEPELVWVKQAITLAQPKKAGGFPSGRKRHSVANHIAEAFAGLGQGESLTVDEIVAFKSSEYGDDPLTRQAVLAHLESKKFKSASAVQVGETEDGETALIKK